MSIEVSPTERGIVVEIPANMLTHLFSHCAVTLDVDLADQLQSDLAEAVEKYDAKPDPDEYEIRRLRGQ